MHAQAREQNELIAELRAQLQHAQAALEVRDRQIKQRDVRIDVLEAKLASLKRKLFGRTSEKLSPEQLALWRADQQEEIAAVEAELEQLCIDPEAATVSGDARHPRRPIELPRKLPRRTEVLDVDGPCAGCGGALHKIGEECTQTIEWIPARAEVKVLIRPKYACRTCETITVAELPDRVNAKCILGESVAAQVLIGKFDDHLPLHRLRKIFGRHDLDVPESTLADLAGRSSFAVTPLVDRMSELILQGGKLHADDTPVTVMVPGEDRMTPKEGRFWVYHRDQTAQGPPLKPMVVFTFSPGRAGHYPQTFLKDFKGYLQVDAFSGFGALFSAGEIKEVACWAHYPESRFIPSNAQTRVFAPTFFIQVLGIIAGPPANSPCHPKTCCCVLYAKRRVTDDTDEVGHETWRERRSADGCC